MIIITLIIIIIINTSKFSRISHVNRRSHYQFTLSVFIVGHHYSSLQYLSPYRSLVSVSSIYLLIDLQYLSPLSISSISFYYRSSVSVSSIYLLTDLQYWFLVSVSSIGAFCPSPVAIFVSVCVLCSDISEISWFAVLIMCDV